MRKPVHLPGKPRDWNAIRVGLVKTIHRCIDGLSPWPLFLWGSPGTGKTCAGLCVLDLAGGEYFTAEELAEQHNAAKFGRFELKGELTVFRPNASNFRRIKLDYPPLVVLDELGVRGTATQSQYEIVKHVLDIREGRPLIVISNLGREELERAYDARIVSRLGAGTIEDTTGPDRRLL